MESTVNENVSGPPDEKKKIWLEGRFRELETRRAFWNTQFDDISRLIRPGSSDFMSNSPFTKGEERHRDIFDGTALWALDQFAAGMFSYLSPATERWAVFSPVGLSYADLSREAHMYLESIGDILFLTYNQAVTNFNPSLHEIYLDIGGFGTSVLYQFWDTRKKHLAFRAYPLGACYIDEDSNGRVDTMFRKTLMTVRQVMQDFPDGCPPEFCKRSPGEQITVIHSVLPRSDKKPGFMKNNKAWGSYYWSPDLKAILSEGGYNSFPYHVPRWTKMAGEVYGRSPGMVCLPEVRMLNQMNKELIKSAHLANSPPIMYEEDSFMLPISTIAPRSLLPIRAGTQNMPQPLMSGSQPQLALDLLQSKRDTILQAFYVDMLLREKKKERQTITEILDERNEMLRQLSPMLGRLQNELLDTVIQRSIELLVEHDILPAEAPEELAGEHVQIVYTSPAAVAQHGSKGGAITQFLNDLAPIAQFRPDVLDHLDSDELFQELVRLRDVTRKIVKPARQVKKEREERAQQAQMEQQGQMAEAMGDASGAVKNIADARATDPSLVDSLLG